MEMRKFGKTDMEVSVLGFGGAEIGFERTSPEHVAQVLGAALDAGLNVIDTAECYLESEELIGRAVAGRRDDYLLFTKCGHPDSPGVPDWRPESLAASIERSLKRLRTDRLDLIQLHSCSEEELRRGDVIAVLQQAREKGQARYIGYSGDGQAAKYAIESGAFDALQTSVNIADQEAIELTIPLAMKAGMGVIAKRPIANAAWRYDREPENGYHAPYWGRLRKLAYEFARNDRAMAAAVALRFTVNLPGVHTAIVGTTKRERWAQNAALLEAGPLTPADFDSIRARWLEVADPTWTGQT